MHNLAAREMVVLEFFDEKPVWSAEELQPYVDLSPVELRASLSILKELGHLKRLGAYKRHRFRKIRPPRISIHLKIRAIMETDATKNWTCKELMQALGCGRTATWKALCILREAQVVRRHGHGNKVVYRLCNGLPYEDPTSKLTVKLKIYLTQSDADDFFACVPEGQRSLIIRMLIQTYVRTNGH